jgi:hypothetical protein
MVLGDGGSSSDGAISWRSRIGSCDQGDWSSMGCSWISSSSKSKCLGIVGRLVSSNSGGRVRCGSSNIDGRGRCGSNIFMRVSSNDSRVCFSKPKEQSIIVLGHGFISIALEPLDHDLEVIVVPLSFCWCCSFCKHHIHLLLQHNSF